MFKIVKGSTLAALREQAAQLPALRQQLAAAQEQVAAAQDVESARSDADEARADAAHARAMLKVIEDDKVAGLAALRDAVRDPVRAPSVRGRIALQLVRDQIELGKAEAARNGREIEPGLRLVEMLLSDETDDGALPVLNVAGAE